MNKERKSTPAPLACIRRGVAKQIYSLYFQGRSYEDIQNWSAMDLSHVEIAVEQIDSVITDFNAIHH